MLSGSNNGKSPSFYANLSEGKKRDLPVYIYLPVYFTHGLPRNYYSNAFYHYLSYLLLASSISMTSHLRPDLPCLSVPFLLINKLLKQLLSNNHPVPHKNFSSETFTNFFCIHSNGKKTYKIRFIIVTQQWNF